jgi:hypothetical protein
MPHTLPGISVIVRFPRTVEDSLCCVEFSSILVVDRGFHARRAVAPAAIIEITHPLRDDFPRFIPGAKVMTRQDLPFQGRKERFGGGIIPRHQLRPIPLLRSEWCG